MNYLSLLCLISLNVYYIECASMPLKFVTSPDRPTTMLDSSPVIVDSSNRHTGGKLLPSHVTVTSKPYQFVADNDPLDLDISGETALGAWRRWFAKENRTKAQATIAANPNEKTFTQQQIMEKLFSDYHKHLKEQGNSSDRLYKPTQVSSPWPLDTEPEDKPVISVSPSDAISNFKYGYQPQYPQTQNFPQNQNYPQTQKYPQSQSYPQPQRPHNFHNFNNNNNNNHNHNNNNNHNHNNNNNNNHNNNHNHSPPKDGWVSLEPVPWSTSKISKWTPNKVGSSGASVPWGGQKPGWTDRPQEYGDNKPWNDNKPPSYGDRPQVAIWNTENKPQWGGEGGSSAGWPHEPANQPGWTNTPVSNPPLKPSWSDIPSKPQWNGAGNPPATPKPWIDNKPGWSENKPVGWNDNKPVGWNDNKPGGWTDLNQRPTPGSRPPGAWRPAPEANHPLGIITDGRPPEWPSDPPASKPTSYPATWLRPQKGDWTRPVHSGNPYPVHSELHYNEDDEEKTASTQASASVNTSESGKWVLLSSTRGYTVPPLTSRGNRAFKFSASPNNMASISTNRGVRLTVLPALGNTSTLSHGGLLEVDKSFETVEAAAAASHASLAISSAKPLIIKHKHKPHHKKGKPARQQSLNGTSSGSPPPIQYFSTGSATAVELQNRNKALIAAIGAGMLPATVAALVPMFLGKRRRRRRSLVLDMLEEAQNRLRHSSLPRSTFNVTH